MLDKQSMVKIDSLVNSVNHLNERVDSLNKVVNKTEIGTSFFFSIIGLQLAIFLLLVGAVGWIGWTSIFNYIKKLRGETEDAYDNLIIKVDNAILELRTITDTNQFDICRSMYLVVEPDLKFGWALKASHAASKINDFENSSNWLTYAEDTIKDLCYDHEYTLSRLAFLEKTISELEALNLSDITEKTTLIKKKLYQMIYVPISPENSDGKEGACE